MRHAGLVVLAALAAAAPVVTAHADPDARTAREGVREGRLVTLESLLSRLEPQHPGRFVEAELEDEHGRLVYEIEWQSPDGRMLEFEFDARTGELLEREDHGVPDAHHR